MKIFIVDDEHIIRMGLKKIISRICPSYEIIGLSDNGRDALVLIEDLLPEVVITDIRMPEMDGIELARKLYELNNRRENNNRIKCIILSGYGEFSYAQEAMKYEVSEYILKPVNEEKLKNTLMNIEEQIREERDRSSHVNLHIRKGLPAIKEKAIRDLLFYNQGKKADCQKSLDEIGIVFIYNAFVAVCIKLDNYPAIKHKTDIRYVLDMENAESLEITYNTFKMYYSFVSSSEVVLILNFDSSKTDIELEKGLIPEVKNRICHLDEYTVSFGVSDIFDDLDDFKLQYENALETLECRFYYGRNSIYYKNCLDKDDKMTIAEIESKVDKVKHIVETGSIAGMSELTSNIFSIMKSNHVTNLSEVFALLYLVYHKFIVECGVFSKLLIRGYAEKDFFEQLNQFEFAEDMEHFLCNILMNLLKLIHDGKNKNERLMQDSVDFIRKYYWKNLSLEVMATRMYISPSYFSDLFKQEIGTSFVEYVKEVRIENAKEFLKDKDLKIYDVSCMVGYEDSNYFSRIFKKVVGISPVEYRDKID